MTTEFLKSDSGASPRMLAVSASMHLIAIFLLILGARYFTEKTAIPDFGVTSVKLVESKPSTSFALEHVSHQPPSDSQPQPSMDSTEPLRKSSAEVERLTSTFARVDAPAPIQMKKRKRNPDKIEPKKKSSESKAKVEPPKSKPENNSKDFLEKRLAAIKKELESRKSGTVNDNNAKGLNTPAGSGGRMPGTAAAGDAELSRWFDAVRNRINSKWSLFGDEQKAPHVTIISVQLADDGRLLGANIDTSSGDRFFDNSAMRAVYQASPFPPLSAEVSGKIRAAGGLALRFTPGGLQ